jgi:hypothetical protein
MPQHTANTWALDENWDLVLDGNGNPKMLTGVEAVCQNVANECRLFLHDAYFRYDEGIDWFTDQLGQKIQESVLMSRLRNAALSVDGVLSVQSIEITELDQKTRTLHGVVNLNTVYGNGRSSF